MIRDLAPTGAAAVHQALEHQLFRGFGRELHFLPVRRLERPELAGFGPRGNVLIGRRPGLRLAVQAGRVDVAAIAVLRGSDRLGWIAGIKRWARRIRRQVLAFLLGQRRIETHQQFIKIGIVQLPGFFVVCRTTHGLSLSWCP